VTHIGLNAAGFCPDTFTPEQRSENLRRIRGTDTGPEILPGRMRAMARRAAFFAGAVLLAVTPSLPAAEPGSSGAPIRGVRGEPVARAVVRWSDMARQGARALAARSAKESDRPRPIPQDLPVPKGALVRMEARAEAAALPSATPPSPAPAASFEALPNSPETQPPDTHGAVGPNHLMVTLNSDVLIQDRSGNALSTVTLAAFWGRVSGGNPFDPRVVYDPYADRWITTAVGNFYGSLLVGVSRTGDPTGSWNLYKIDPAPLRVDFPNLGFNKDWIVVRGSMFTSTFEYSQQVWVFGKANLYAGGRGSFTAISGEAGTPAVTLDPAVSTLYLVSNWNGNADGNGVLRLYTITGSIGSEVLTPVAFVATPNPWTNLWSEFCPQMGDPRKIVCHGGIEVVFRNGTIWAAHLIYLPADSPTRNAIQWWQLAPDGGVVQRGRLDDASGVLFYGYPSLAVNGSDDMLLGFASFSAQQFASGSYAYRAAGDPRSTLRTERVLKAGEDSYFRGDHGNPWGDYSATSVDPVNDTDFWTIQEYAAARDPVSGASRWGTWWGRVVPEAAVAGAPCVAGATVLCLNENRFQVEVSWRVPSQGTAGIGTAQPLTGDTGYFWFFNAANVELVLKVLDGRAINGKFWVFYGALSDVEYTIMVTDTITGATKTYTNPQGRLASVADTAAF